MRPARGLESGVASGRRALSKHFRLLAVSKYFNETEKAMIQGVAWQYLCI